eukprot:1160901-Pelagomonas_calceolata.AAC.4
MVKAGRGAMQTIGKQHGCVNSSAVDHCTSILRHAQIVAPLDFPVPVSQPICTCFGAQMLSRCQNIRAGKTDIIPPSPHLMDVLDVILPVLMVEERKEYERIVNHFQSHMGTRLLVDPVPWEGAGVQRVIGQELRLLKLQTCGNKQGQLPVAAAGISICRRAGQLPMHHED